MRLLGGHFHLIFAAAYVGAGEHASLYAIAIVLFGGFQGVGSMDGGKGGFLSLSNSDIVRAYL